MHKCEHPHTRIHTCMPTHTHSYSHPHARTHLHTHMDIHMHACTHGLSHTHTHLYMCARAHAHLHTLPEARDVALWHSQDLTCKKLWIQWAGGQKAGREEVGEGGRDGSREEGIRQREEKQCRHRLHLRPAMCPSFPHYTSSRPRQREPQHLGPSRKSSSQENYSHLVTHPNHHYCVNEWKTSLNISRQMTQFPERPLQM